MIFPNLCIFWLFVVSIISPLISDDGDFVYCRVISEMQHALETRLPFYKWRYEYLLNLCDRMAMMKAMPLKVECSNKISPLLHSYFYNIQSSLLKMSHFQKLAYSVRTMFAIVEKMISLVSFDVRLAHAGTSFIFSYLIFSNFKFCQRKFKGLII